MEFCMFRFDGVLYSLAALAPWAFDKKALEKEIAAFAFYNANGKLLAVVHVSGVQVKHQSARMYERVAEVLDALLRVNCLV